MLFLGDLGVEGGKQLLNSEFAEEVPSDIVQVSHHGQNGVNKEFYKRVQEIIEIMKYFPATSEEDYISKLIEMIYSEINFPNRA